MGLSAEDAPLRICLTLSDGAIILQSVVRDLLNRRYAEAMPTLPVLGAGFAPLLQWTLLPPIVMWFVRRQLTGRGFLRPAESDTSLEPRS